MIRCVEVRLTIPDNEARTALATLQRLGIAIEGLERADLYRFDVDDDAGERLLADVRGAETIFNPNKHALRVREEDGPVAGEVWIDEIAPAAQRRATGALRAGGRALRGVRSFERFTAWRLLEAGRTPARAHLVTAATQTLLCNPAFQKARS